MNLEKLICSGIRQEIMLRLLDGPERLTRLRPESKKQNVNNAIQPLLDDGLIDGKDGIYHLTDIGRAYALILRNVINSAEVLQDDFWKVHDLSSIPDHLLARIGDLAGGQVVYPDGDFVAAQKNFADALKRAKVIYGASSIFVSGWPEAIVEAIEAGADVHLIFTLDVCKKVEDSALGRWLDGIDCAIQDFQAAFTVADDTLYLGLFVRGGGADLIREYVCSGTGAVSWGRDLYNYYRDQ